MATFAPKRQHIAQLRCRMESVAASNPHPRTMDPRTSAHVHLTLPDKHIVLASHVAFVYHASQHIYIVKSQKVKSCNVIVVIDSAEIYVFICVFCVYCVVCGMYVCWVLSLLTCLMFSGDHVTQHIMYPKRINYKNAPSCNVMFVTISGK